MTLGRDGGRDSSPGLRGLAPAFAAALALAGWPTAAAAGAGPPKLVVVIYPDESDGAPGVVLVNRAIRSTFASESPAHVEVRNEYVNTSRLPDPDFAHAQVSLLRRKYAGRKVDLVIAGLSSGLDFALKHRGELFPGVPIVFVAVDEREVKARRLPPDVIGHPVHMDLAATLDLALRFHPDTRRVFVVAGSAPFDTGWADEARRTFLPHEGRLEFVYLTGLPMADLLDRVAGLPEHSIVYYLHVNRDGAGEQLIPAVALERLASRANVPIYGHVDTYVGRGAVGGRVFTFEAEGKTAAQLGLRLLAGERPEAVAVSERNENTDLFDARQLSRWGLDETRLPPGSVVRFREPSFWVVYRWQVFGVAFLCVVEGLLIAGLFLQLVKRRRAEGESRANRRELQLLTRRLLVAQEVERRRIARELHDDVNQSLALLTVEIDLLARQPPASDEQLAEQLRDLSARVKDLSSSVHDLSHQLHPAKLEQLGLVAAVRGLGAELYRHHGLEVTFTHHTVPEAIPEDVGLCLYRIVQEALRNVIKHSGTCFATVELTGAPDGLRLRVGDEGAGFDPAAAHGGGLGLVSMRERLYLVGGEIEVRSRPGGGTRIDVRVPALVRARPESERLCEAVGGT
jgi:signal transduction histidine kinase